MVNIAHSLLHSSLGLLTLASIVRTMKTSSSTSLRALPPQCRRGARPPASGASETEAV
ncbi:hypothetical protein PF007_g27337 [Phytophthora fragariae]|uniref:RxLR effector protein n=1 Tax=Phytophthora fragariae TaxID=53985 RepID=A0A6A3DQ62_9STRA|nr:hypothetical protein PF003_g39454 [Phytophthora fragariae]KAE8921917.1 hypothetical protein PF009_g27808 [Phytophthora fragariae]KAE8970596.1 hypothetical protein PF011_g26357 [Phytophthora fragariae]KAE9069387.1 hypothetical protein PF007_g27337 [Phytophthora fragariae]KAE9083219.1 hypothetical protein PF006_g26733 [Phytophthora fragariae]